MRALSFLAAVLVAGVVLAQSREPASASSGGGLTEAQVLAAVSDAGTLNRADRDTYARAFVAQGTSADGGVVGEAYSCQQSPCTWRMAAGSQMTVTCQNNSCAWNVSEQSMPQLYLTALVTGGSSDAYQFAQPGTFWRDFPTTDITGCDASSAGGRRFLSTNNRMHVCDGTALRPLTQEVDGAIQLPTYTTAGLPSASPAGRLVYDTDAGCMKVSNGTTWSCS